MEGNALGFRGVGCGRMLRECGEMDFGLVLEVGIFREILDDDVYLEWELLDYLVPHSGFFGFASLVEVTKRFVGNKRVLHHLKSLCIDFLICYRRVLWADLDLDLVHQH